MRIINICAKCSDLFAASLDGKDYVGYVPDWMPGNHWGDYIELNIDIDTGKIMNWKTPSNKELAETFEK